MQYYVHSKGQQMGPYELDQLRSLLVAGTFQPTDLAWHEGAAEWATLNSFSSIVGPTSPGAANPSEISRGAALASQEPRTSGLAISSLVLGILSFFTLGLAGIPAVICGHVSLSQIKKAAGRISGSGLAIGGLVTGYIGCFLAMISIPAILAGIALPVFAAVQERGKATQCLSQAKQIGLACKLYAVDHGGNYPPTMDDLIPDYLADRHLFTCPMTGDATTVGYEYFGGKDNDPAEKVLLKSKATMKNHRRIVITSDCGGTIKLD